MLVVRTGGQSGVDRAALDAAISTGIDYTGWCPRGGWAEDFPEPPGLLRDYPKLIETPSLEPQQRTAWNVRDGDATLIVTLGPSCTSDGTEFTALCARLVFVKPLFVSDLSVDHQLEAASTWLRRMLAAHAAASFVLNISGPRESECPGIYERARPFIERLTTVAEH